MRTTHDTDNVQPHRYALLLSALAYGNTRVLSFVLGLFSRDSIRRAIASRCVYACLAASQRYRGRSQPFEPWNTDSTDDTRASFSHSSN